MNQMRKFSYWLCFSVVALGSLLTYGDWLLSLWGARLPTAGMASVFSLVGSLVPPMFVRLLPWPVAVGLSLIMLGLVVRRLWLLAAKRQGVPHSFAGLPQVLGYIGAASFTLALVVLLLSLFLRAGSGVPGAMLALPAAFCIPWAVFLTEVLSFRGEKAVVPERGSTSSIPSQDAVDRSVEQALAQFRAGISVTAACPSCRSIVSVVPDKVQFNAGRKRVEVECECHDCNGRFDVLRQSA